MTNIRYEQSSKKETKNATFWPFFPSWGIWPICTTDEEMQNLHLHIRLHGLMQSQSPYFHSPILLAMCSLQFTWGGSRMQWWLSEACIDFSTDGGSSFISCTVWWDEDISHFADPFPAGNCLYFYWVLNDASIPHFPFSAAQDSLIGDFVSH